MTERKPKATDHAQEREKIGEQEHGAVERITQMVDTKAGGIQLHVFEDLWRMAQAAVNGNTIPKNFPRRDASREEKVAATATVMQAGMELGFAPMRSLSALTFINGRMGIMGEAARALVRVRKGLKPGTEIVHAFSELPPEGTSLKDWPDEAACKVWCHPATSKQPQSATWTVGMARRAGLWGNDGPWRLYPLRMLMNRAWGELQKDYFSHITMGLLTSEETQDLPPEETERAPAHSGQGPGQEDPILAGSAGQASSAPQPTAEPGPRDSPAAADAVRQSGEPGKDSEGAAEPEPQGGEAQGSGSETANGGEDAESAPASAPQERLF